MIDAIAGLLSSGVDILSELPHEYLHYLPAIEARLRENFGDKMTMSQVLELVNNLSDQFNPSKASELANIIPNGDLTVDDDMSVVELPSVDAIVGGFINGFTN